MKKRLSTLISALCVSAVLVTTLGGTLVHAEAEQAPKDIKFYGKIVEYTSGEPTCAKLQEKLDGKYNIESLQVDWGNLEQVVRTGIASGEPCDIYNYWAMFMRPLVDEGMALDLTPYLDENDGEWRKTFNPSLLDIGKYDGKNYSITTTINFRTMIINADIFKENNIPIPEGDYWAWDEFVDACAKLDAAGVYPLAAPVDNQKSDWIFGNGIYRIVKIEFYRRNVSDVRFRKWQKS